MINFELPSLGADMDEGKLLEWKVKPGDKVARGQVVAVVDTSKAAVDVEIWQDGVVEELLVEPGQKFPVGTVMATLSEAGEKSTKQAARVEPTQAAKVESKPAAKVESKPAEKVEPKPAAKVEPKQAPKPEPEAEPVAKPKSKLKRKPDRKAKPKARQEPAPSAPPSRLPPPQAVVEAARHPVSPAARHRARELGVEVESLEGSGAGGAVTIADVERAASSSAAPPTPKPSAATASAPAPPPIDRQREMRRAIAAAMSRSKREIPHYYLSESIPMANALVWLAERNAQLPIADRVLPAVVQLKAVALALRRTPELNGLFVNDEFVASPSVHAGVAISLRAGGLVAPAIHDVGEKPLAQLMRELADLVRRARAGSLRSSEMSDPTITVTNLGDQGVEMVAGVIYPPQVALVGFGRIADRPWAQDGWLRAAPLVTATLAADHRVSDGHRGALFLAELRELLQRPDELDAGA